MRLLVLGATGNIGREIVDLALARGHQVTAFVRSPQKIARHHEALAVDPGDPLDVDQLSRALVGHDAVISALGLPARRALRPATFMAESAACIVAAMQRADVERLAIVSAAVLFPMRGAFFAFFRWLLRHHARDLSAMETVVRATELDWTIARPPRLVRGGDTGYRARAGALPVRAYSMSFRAVAAFLIDSVERQTNLREIVGLGSADGAP